MNIKSKIFLNLIYILFFPTVAVAQIAPDTTQPVNTIVNSQDNTFIIEGGTTSGSNLFHSFTNFSVPTNSTAHFNNVETIQNIFSRVTGGSVSNIDGLIKANGTANLFLINPNGIIFGSNASLNIGGSFLASTANSFVFPDGSQFSATNPQAPPLLTVNVPIGLQFGSTSQPIIVQGSGHNFTVDRESGRVTRNQSPNSLTVAPGNTLALIGGDVTLVGGNLIANGGRIELWSIANGQLSIVNTNGKITINEGQVTNEYGNIQLTNSASVDISGNSGEIQVRGGRISLSDGSTIIAVTEGGETGGSLNIKATDSVEIIGTTNDSRLFRSSLLSQAQGEAKAGDLTIETRQLVVNGGEIAASTFGAGDAGNIAVVAEDSVELSGIETDGELTSGLFSLVNPEATGNGGNLTVATRQLIVSNGAQIATTTFSDGKGGNLNIVASELVKLIGGTTIIDPFTELPYPSGLFSQSQGLGDGGNLTIETPQLIINDAAEIASTTFGNGNAGNLLIRASELVKVSTNGGISTQVNELEAIGNGGNIIFETRQLIVEDGGQISTSTFGIGAGGNLIVRGIESETESVEVIGTSIDEFPSGLFAITAGTGAGGNLTVNTRRLIAQNGGQIAASSLSEGAGGTVTVNAAEFVQLSGVGKSVEGEVIRTEEGDIIRSGLFARTRLEGSGAAGSVEINTPSLTVNNGATVTVSSRLGSEDAAAGNLRVNANNIRLQNGIITAETNSGDFGNIDLISNNIQLRENSNITTSASGTGGNIGINTDILVALENSDITANSEDSRGGQININVQGIYRQGFISTDVSREGSDRTSDITATSQLGPQFDGVVNLQTPEVDPTQSLINLPQIAVAPILQNLCAVEAGNEEFSEFVDVGRGGLPPKPREMVNLLAATDVPETKEIVEAQGWVKDANGVIHLVVQSSNVMPHSPQVSLPACSSKKSSAN